MGNILAITRKELGSYFASPIAYVVVGLFALVFGWFYYVYVALFVRQSMQMGQFMGPQTVNINQQMIRYLLLNTSVVALFMLPMITMRTYAEEKRTGTIELLLTSPLTDLQIIVGKFLGALTLYALMLSVTLPHMALLFWYGDPEWKPIASGYLGLLLMGGCFIALGLLISSMTRNQIVAGIVTFAMLLMLWVVNWMSDFAGPTAREVLAYLSITEHFEDFAKGVIDTKHLVYYLSLIAFGLFLTAKSVDSERWRG
jgi:ABC-2 type transport system permease protein